MLPPPTQPTLFPYTTLFRSSRQPPAARQRAGGKPGERAKRKPRRPRPRKPPAAATHPPAGAPPHRRPRPDRRPGRRSEEHTSELQSPCNLVCRLLLEKKNNT